MEPHRSDQRVGSHDTTAERCDDSLAFWTVGLRPDALVTLNTLLSMMPRVRRAFLTPKCI